MHAQLQALASHRELHYLGVMKPTQKTTSFTHVTEWIFDLDNTLYPREAALFVQIDKRITGYVARLTGLMPDEARILQKKLYRDHGTTLAGLMAEHGIDPLHYLNDVHDIDYSVLKPHPELGEAIAALPGRKHIFTNGDTRHAEKTLAALGIEPHFDATFDIVAAQYKPKPHPDAFGKFITSHKLDPREAVMFEDMARNLEQAKKHGMATVLVIPPANTEHGAEDWEFDGHDGDHIDHVTDDLRRFLTDIARLA